MMVLNSPFILFLLVLCAGMFDKQMPMDVAPEQSIQLSFTITASKCDGPVHRKVIFKVTVVHSALVYAYHCTDLTLYFSLCICARSSMDLKL